MTLRTLLVALSLLVGVFPSMVRGEVIDRVVVTVGTEVVTESRVRFVLAFLTVTGGRGMGRPVPPVDQLDLAAVQRVLEDDAIIYGMASRLPIINISAEGVRARLEWFESQFESDAEREAFVTTWGFERGEQWRFFRRRLTIEAFITLKIGTGVEASEEELRAFFDANPGRYERSFEESRERVRADLGELTRTKTFAGWMEAYRRNHSDMIRRPIPLEEKGKKGG